ncbi:MAG: gliding motility lipoprotein GldD [Flavobacteriales bacterium]|nr:gliding motility lipoprotein GldD [Flavobacteriales bacterium]
MKNNILILCFFALIATLTSCEENYTPRPRGYFRIDFPEKTYDVYTTRCPLITEIPVYSKVEILDSGNDTCWFNIVMPRYNARLYCTYLMVDQDIHLMIDAAYKFAFKHEMKAEAIARTELHVDSTRVHGMVYDLEGDVASPVQFYVTDSTNHFLRGSLYFDHAPNADSLAPVVDFIRRDITHMMETVKWQ